MKADRIFDDAGTVTTMIKIYCDGKHGTIHREELCEECLELVSYADYKLKHCKFGDKKPVCGKCTVHCYKPEMREKIRAVMRYSGPKMVYMHPIMLIKYVKNKLIY